MKYAIIIPDGCADEPIPDLQGRTPLQAAKLPFMDAVAKAGSPGWLAIPQSIFLPVPRSPI